jgi:hypothetical protein
MLRSQAAAARIGRERAAAMAHQRPTRCGLIDESGHERRCQTVLLRTCSSRSADWQNKRKNADGFGLGLSIARSVAVAHGGTITASSRQDGGLDVSVLLPRSPAGDAPDDNL